MSLIPMLRRPVDLFDQHFGHHLDGDWHDLKYLWNMPLLSSHYLRPWRVSPLKESGLSRITDDKTHFKVVLDVQQFKPEEVTVKVAEKYITVEGKHEEREDEHGFIARQFMRRYTIPEGVDPDAVMSQLSSDGVLTISAPKKVQAISSERVVPIVQTQAPVAHQKSPKPKIEDKMDQ